MKIFNTEKEWHDILEQSKKEPLCVFKHSNRWYFGPKTEQSVKTFHQQNNLIVDGVARKMTCSLL